MGIEKTKICPKCKSKMEEGVAPEGSEDWQKYNLQWGEKVPGLDFGSKEAIKLKTFSCETCGYTELYTKKV